MNSLRDLYKIGHGPSSSHSIGPSRAAEYLKTKYKNIEKAEVILYGSLALTGKGHMTDEALISTFDPIPCKVTFDIDTNVKHQNTMDFILYLKSGEVINKRVLSIGGGTVRIDGEPDESMVDVYPEKNFSEIRDLCEKNKWTLVDYVRHYEGDEIFDYLAKVHYTMMKTIDIGLNREGLLPGKLRISRKAHHFLTPKYASESQTGKSYRLVMSYAYATGEENASGDIVVTAPTCGSSGTLPAVLKFYKDDYKLKDEKLIEALAVAGVIGNVIKRNGSISGAEAGCQAEIGSACSMAAAAFAYIKGMSTYQIEVAAEIAMEHSLGSTCDPVMGYVIIPCIERNAVAAVHAITSARLAEYVSDAHVVSFDTIIKTMYETGKDINKKYRETAMGGLASAITGD